LQKKQQEQVSHRMGATLPRWRQIMTLETVTDTNHPFGRHGPFESMAFEIPQEMKVQPGFEQRHPPFGPTSGSSTHR